MKARVQVIRPADADVRERGGGVWTTHLIRARSVPSAPFTIGTTEFSPGAVVDFHSHNCAESVLVLEGSARFEAEGAAHDLEVDDVTFVPPGIPDRLVNRGSSRMRLFFIYAAAYPTRTMLGSDETFLVGSGDDVLRPGTQS